MSCKAVLKEESFTKGLEYRDCRCVPNKYKNLWSWIRKQQPTCSSLWKVASYFHAFTKTTCTDALIITVKWSQIPTFLPRVSLIQWCRRRGCRVYKRSPRNWDLSNIREKSLKIWPNRSKFGKKWRPTLAEKHMRPFLWGLPRKGIHDLICRQK